MSIQFEYLQAGIYITGPHYDSYRITNAYRRMATEEPLIRQYLGRLDKASTVIRDMLERSNVDVSKFYREFTQASLILFWKEMFTEGEYYHQMEWTLSVGDMAFYIEIDRDYRPIDKYAGGIVDGDRRRMDIGDIVEMIANPDAMRPISEPDPDIRIYQKPTLDVPTPSELADRIDHFKSLSVLHLSRQRNKSNTDELNHRLFIYTADWHRFQSLSETLSYTEFFWHMTPIRTRLSETARAVSDMTKHLEARIRFHAKPL